jgi:cellulose biosynthesis protein BcsQ
MKTLSVYNIKGGVGKTATVVNLSYLAASEGANTLVCDLDPQGSATFYFRIRSGVKSGAKTLVKGGRKIDKNIKGTDYENLDLFPSDFSFRNLDLKFAQLNKSKQRLSKTMASFTGEYDYIFLDCPPNITLVSENVFNASDYVLVPVIPTTLSLRTFKKIISFFNNHSFKAKQIIPFFSMVEIRKKMHREIIQKMRGKYSGILESTIPYASIVEQMGIYRAPVTAYRANSAAGEAYKELWREIKQKIISI